MKIGSSRHYCQQFRSARLRAYEMPKGLIGLALLLALSLAPLAIEAQPTSLKGPCEPIEAMRVSESARLEPHAH